MVRAGRARVGPEVCRADGPATPTPNCPEPVFTSQSWGLPCGHRRWGVAPSAWTPADPSCEREDFAVSVLESALG